MIQNYKDRFCSKPWRYMEISSSRKRFFTKINTYICCMEWVPAAIGNPLNYSIEEIWNSRKIKKIRKSILDGTYKYCNKMLCPDIQSGTLPAIKKAMKMENGKYAEIIKKKKITTTIPPDFINLNFDQTCNLKCPSCRKNHIMSSKSETNISKKITDKILKYITRQDQNYLIKLNITGSGDPFASKIFKNFLFSFDGEKHPNIKICIQTNGILFTENAWKKMKKIHNNVSNVIISLDAGSKEVYDKIRINGNWEILYDNLKFISELKKMQKIEFVRLDFLVQKNNYKDMSKFIKICRDLNFIPYFSKIIKWYDSSHFTDNMTIFDEKTGYYKDFINSLKDPVFGWNKIDFGNISKFRDTALNELKKENKKQYLQNIKNHKVISDDKKKLKKIWHNFKSYFVDEKDIINLFDTNTVKINRELVLKFDKNTDSWIKCRQEEIKIYEAYRNNNYKEIWYNNKIYIASNDDVKSLLNTDVVRINSSLLLKYDNSINKWIKCSSDELKIYELHYKAGI